VTVTRLEQTTTDSVPLQQSQLRRQWRIVLVILGVVLIVDQALKAWAWREVPGALVNTGGDPLVGTVIDHWYRDRAQGAALDLLGAGLLIGAACGLARQRRSLPFLIAGALTLAGWSSNVLDRFGLHFLTAPGSARGDIDFIHTGGYYYNLADLVIATGTTMFAVVMATRYAKRFAAFVRTEMAHRQSSRPLVHAVVCVACLVVAASFGAVHDGQFTTTHSVDAVSGGGGARGANSPSTLTASR
jgi:lipoprotein signal peptidase